MENNTDKPCIGLTLKDTDTTIDRSSSPQAHPNWENTLKNMDLLTQMGREYRINKENSVGHFLGIRFRVEYIFAIYDLRIDDPSSLKLLEDVEEVTSYTNTNNNTQVAIVECDGFIHTIYTGGSCICTGRAPEAIAKRSCTSLVNMLNKKGITCSLKNTFGVRNMCASAELPYKIKFDDFAYKQRKNIFFEVNGHEINYNVPGSIVRINICRNGKLYVSGCRGYDQVMQTLKQIHFMLDDFYIKTDCNSENTSTSK